MRICLRRRDFIAAFGGAAAWPLAAQAQQRALPVVGYVSVVSADTATEREVAFRQGLGEAGYSEGRNVTVEYHFLDGKFDRQDAGAFARPRPCLCPPGFLITRPPCGLAGPSRRQGPWLVKNSWLALCYFFSCRHRRVR